MGIGLNSAAGTLAAALMALAFAGCSVFPARNRIDDGRDRAEIAQAVSESAQRVAVAKLGARVCRQLKVGISELDWVRGTVSAVDPDRIRIRIDEPGRFTHVLDGTTVARGVVLWDAQVNWTPCR